MTDVMTFTFSEFTVIIGLLLIAPTLCVLAVLATDRLERKAMRRREATLGAQKWEIEQQLVALETRRLELMWQASNVAVMTRSEIDYLKDETEISADWEIDDGVKEGI